jgi:hypothetical protein
MTLVYGSRAPTIDAAGTAARCQRDAIFYLGHAGMPFLPEHDLSWLLKGLQDGSLAESRSIVCKIVGRLVDTRQNSQMELLWYASESDDLLRAQCQELFVIMLDSETARILRQSLEYEKKPPRKLLDPTPAARVEQTLSKIEAGETNEWISLVQLLIFKPDSNSCYHPDGANLTNLAGWQSATSTREIASFRQLPGAWRAANRTTTHGLLLRRYTFPPSLVIKRFTCLAQNRPTGLRRFSRNLGASGYRSF